MLTFANGLASAVKMLNLSANMLNMISATVLIIIGSVLLYVACRKKEEEEVPRILLVNWIKVFVVAFLANMLLHQL